MFLRTYQMDRALYSLKLKDRFESRKANTIRMQYNNYRRSMLWRSFAILIAIFFAMNRVLWPQAVPSESKAWASQSSERLLIGRQSMGRAEEALPIATECASRVAPQET